LSKNLTLLEAFESLNLKETPLPPLTFFPVSPDKTPPQEDNNIAFCRNCVFWLTFKPK
jgi:hypothetical protein